MQPLINDSRGMAFQMVKPAYLIFAVVTFVIFVVILVAFVALPDNGTPFDRGDSPSLITPGSPGVEDPK
ncbi:MAG: hypothetical protein H0W96_07450 [Solirubrobacterales bacterium]|nr:hypothetical protein [Solirubrobacterales bacterium]